MDEVLVFSICSIFVEGLLIIIYFMSFGFFFEWIKIIIFKLLMGCVVWFVRFVVIEGVGWF